MHFVLFTFHLVTIDLVITEECNDDGLEVGHVDTYGIDEVTGRITVIDVFDYVGQKEKRMAVSRALSTAAHLIEA